MPIVSLAEWDQYLQIHSNAHLLQSGEWGELKSAFGWEPVHIVSGDVGVQILFRRLPLGFMIGYIPKPMNGNQLLVIGNSFWQEVDSICKRHRAIFVKLEADSWEGESLTQIANYSSLITSPQNIQPPRTIVVDIKGSEDDILTRM